MIKTPNSVSRLLSGIVVFALASSIAISRDWFINPQTGNEARTGSETAPLATAQVAVNRAVEQDRIIFLPESAVDRQSIELGSKNSNPLIIGNDTGGIPGFPKTEDLQAGPYRWDRINHDFGWLTYKGPATSGTLRNVKFFNSRARHFLDGGFNIHGDARGIQFFEIVGYENFDEGFSAHDTSDCWITDGKFLRNENAIAGVNNADSYYENFTMGESEDFEILSQGGRHRIINCTLIPGEGSLPLSIAPGTLPGDKTKTRLPSTAVVQNMNLAIDAKAEVKQSLCNSFAIGRHENQSPILAWSRRHSGGAPSKASRIIHFGKHAPQEIAGKLLPDNDWFGLNAPLSTTNFPPSGEAFADDPEAYAVWRWIGLTSPDDVFVPDSPEGRALGAALQEYPPAGVGMVNVFLSQTMKDGSTRTVALPLKGDKTANAKQSMMKRLARTPRELLAQLSVEYGHQFKGSYIDATALISKRNVKVTEKAEELASEFLKEAKRPKNGGDIAGTMLFREFEDEASRKRIIEVADLAFAEDGTPLEAMPTHQEMSDAVYMACPLLTLAGEISGEARYFDQAVKHFKFIQSKCQRDDFIYRHSPLSDAAWGRGNGFPALGLAYVLENFPQTHPDYEFLLESYRNHLNALAKHQDHDGMWHQIIDLPDSYAELSATCMIAASITKGIRHRWLDQEEWLPVVNKAWGALKARVSLDGITLINVCTGTGKQPTLEDYYNRKAILGRDARGGAMALLFTSEIILLQNQ